MDAKIKNGISELVSRNLAYLAGKTFNNVGWVRGTKNTSGGWGAYLWVLQNRIAFQSSTSAWWSTTNGIPVAITNVMVGSLGDYGPMSNVVDIGPHLDAATNNFPGANMHGEEKEYQVDISNVFYQLSIPDIWITPRDAVVTVGGSNVQYMVTGTNLPNGVTWTIIPDDLTNGATISSTGDWHLAEATPGDVATNYKVRATSVDNTNFYDQVNLAVVGLQPPLRYKIGTNSWSDMPDPFYVCKDTTVNFEAIKVPANASWPEGKPVWGGVVSGSGVDSNSYTFSTISTSAADYKIVSAECGNTVTGKAIVLKVEIENTAPRDTDDVQVQYFTNNAGAFTYTAIPLQIYYRLQPDFDWTPDSVELKVKNPAGSTVRTVTLSTSVGQQQTAWDGKDSSGSYVAYGSNYHVEITASIGGTTCTATNNLTVYEIRQGDCVYRPITWDEHAAIVYEYTGGNRLADLQDALKYTVIEHPGEGYTTSTSALGTYTNWIGYYCPAGLTQQQRETILETGHTLDAANLSYVTPPSWDFFNTLIHNSATNSPAGTDWAGTIADVDRIRCDGTVEAAYEDSGVRLYGGDAWWNIMQAGAQSGGNIDRHNNGLDSLSPSKQRAGSLTQNAEDTLFLPQP